MAGFEAKISLAIGTPAAKVLCEAQNMTADASGGVSRVQKIPEATSANTAPKYTMTRRSAPSDTAGPRSLQNPDTNELQKAV